MALQSGKNEAGAYATSTPVPAYIRAQNRKKVTPTIPPDSTDSSTVGAYPPPGGYEPTATSRPVSTIGPTEQPQPTLTPLLSTNTPEATAFPTTVPEITQTDVPLETATPTESLTPVPPTETIAPRTVTKTPDKSALYTGGVRYFGGTKDNPYLSQSNYNRWLSTGGRKFLHNAMLPTAQAMSPSVLQIPKFESKRQDAPYEPILTPTPTALTETEVQPDGTTMFVGRDPAGNNFTSSGPNPDNPPIKLNTIPPANAKAEADRINAVINKYPEKFGVVPAGIEAILNRATTPPNANRAYSVTPEQLNLLSEYFNGVVNTVDADQNTLLGQIEQTFSSILPSWLGEKGKRTFTNAGTDPAELQNAMVGGTQANLSAERNNDFLQEAAPVVASLKSYTTDNSKKIRQLIAPTETAYADALATWARGQGLSLAEIAQTQTPAAAQTQTSVAQTQTAEPTPKGGGGGYADIYGGGGGGGGGGNVNVDPTATPTATTATGGKTQLQPSWNFQRDISTWLPPQLEGQPVDMSFNRAQLLDNPVIGYRFDEKGNRDFSGKGGLTRLNSSQPVYDDQGNETTLGEKTLRDLWNSGSPNPPNTSGTFFGSALDAEGNYVGGRPLAATAADYLNRIFTNSDYISMNDLPALTVATDPTTGAESLSPVDVNGNPMYFNSNNEQTDASGNVIPATEAQYMFPSGSFTQDIRSQIPGYTAGRILNPALEVASTVGSAGKSGPGSKKATEIAGRTATAVAQSTAPSGSTSSNVTATPTNIYPPTATRYGEATTTPTPTTTSTTPVGTRSREQAAQEAVDAQAQSKKEQEERAWWDIRNLWAPSYDATPTNTPTKTPTQGGPFVPTKTPTPFMPQPTKTPTPFMPQPTTTPTPGETGNVSGGGIGNKGTGVSNLNFAGMASNALAQAQAKIQQSAQNWLQQSQDKGVARWQPNGAMSAAQQQNQQPQVQVQPQTQQNPMMYLDPSKMGLGTPKILPSVPATGSAPVVGGGTGGTGGTGGSSTGSSSGSTGGTTSTTGGVNKPNGGGLGAKYARIESSKKNGKLKKDISTGSGLTAHATQPVPESPMPKIKTMYGKYKFPTSNVDSRSKFGEKMSLSQPIRKQMTPINSTQTKAFVNPHEITPNVMQYPPARTPQHVLPVVMNNEVPLQTVAPVTTKYNTQSQYVRKVMGAEHVAYKSTMATTNLNEKYKITDAKKKFSK
jgi:hypothetical protein